MKKPANIVILVLVLGVGGAALMITLFARHGFTDVSEAVAAAGWGVVAVLAFHLVPLFFDVLGWQAVLPPENRLPYLALYKIRWIGDSVSSMLPVAQVGGEIVRVRLAAARGVPTPIAAASVLVGMTVSLVTQIVFTLSGMMVLTFESGTHNVLWPTITATFVFLCAIAGFFAVQHYGIFRMIGAIIAHLVKGKEWQGLAARGATLDQAVRDLYKERRRVLMCCVWTMMVWMTGAIEVFISFKALGLQGGYGDAYALESMSQFLRSAAFLVPGALGVQEGGYVVVGGMLGYSPADCMALALIRRVRELAFGVPGVLAWQWTEGFAWFKRRSVARSAVGEPALNKAP
jgi:putative membrane protein